MRGKNYEPELNYFLSSTGIAYTLQYPEIFICVVDLIFTTGSNEMLKELLNYEYEANSKFFRYTCPDILYGLFEILCVAPEYVLITLILIIHCAREQANRAFAYIFERRDRLSSRKEYENAFINAKYLWDILNSSETLRQFQEKLLERGLYDAAYADLYEKMYLDHVEREKALYQDRTNYW